MCRAVFVDRTADLRQVMEARKLPVPAHLHVHDGDPSVDDLARMCQDAEVVLVEHTAVPPTVLAACPSVRAVIFMGTGAGTYIDLADAAQRGITVLTTPGYGDQAVAEHAMALLFAAARGVARGDADIRRGLWRPAGGLQLRGQKLAVVGLGGIGTCFAGIAHSLGMKVKAWNRTPREHHAYCADLDDVLRDAAVVSLHLGLNENTQGLLDARRLALPSAGFILVNTARAGLVDESALLAGLRSSRIGHAALDVFPQEPLPARNPYCELENVTLTPHVAYMTDAAYENLWLRTLSVYYDIAD